MKSVNDAVKWISGICLVALALWLIAQFVVDYDRTQTRLGAVEKTDVTKN